MYTLLFRLILISALFGLGTSLTAFETRNLSI
jgi:hypothetical protein